MHLPVVRRLLLTVCFLLGLSFALFGAAFGYYWLSSHVPGWETIDPPSALAYASETQVEGYSFRVELFRIRPFLSEYRKAFSIRRPDGTLILKRDFMDTGGLASFYFLRDGKRIDIIDGSLRALALEIPSGTVSDLPHSDIPRDFVKKSFGRFMFLPSGTNVIYGWAPAGDGPLPGGR